MLRRITMDKRIDEIISKLEKIPVSGVHAILMGDSLKELMLLREEVKDDSKDIPLVEKDMEGD